MTPELDRAQAEARAWAYQAHVNRRSDRVNLTFEITFDEIARCEMRIHLRVGLSQVEIPCVCLDYNPSDAVEGCIRQVLQVVEDMKVTR